MGTRRVRAAWYGSVDMSRRLSKSRFCYGLQCLRQLWWRVHEPDAPELTPSPAQQAVFSRGHLVGELAHRSFPGAVLVDRPHDAVAEKVADTRAALKARAPAVLEASFVEASVFVAIDALERLRVGHALVEVKSTLSVKEQHVPDVAIQLYVARQAGLDVRRAEVMHLNRECRAPDLSNLFVREDVTDQAEAFQPEILGHLARMQDAIAGPLPMLPTGSHCAEPYECPFVGRCWPEVPADHISTLYRGGKTAQALLTRGVTRIQDVPEGTRLSAPASRQVTSVRSGKTVVESGLAGALEALSSPVAYLDFETVMPAVPAWDGCHPYEQVPVQLSCHVVSARGRVTHHAFLPQGPGDPRPAMAEAVVRAVDGAATVVAYNAPFERRCLEHLADAVPRLRKPLEAAARKLVDLLPIVRDHVYHPDFGGSFSIKSVAPALVPGLSYGMLEVAEGGTAQALLEGLLLGGEELPPANRARLREQLLAYCEQDTRAMVEVVGALQALAR